MKIDMERLDSGFVITVDNETRIGVSNETVLESKNTQFDCRRNESKRFDVFQKTKINVDRNRYAFCSINFLTTLHVYA